MPKELTKQQHLVHSFFSLKGWEYTPGDPKAAILFRRYLRPANDLLVLCDGDLLRAQQVMEKVKNWAASLSLSWSMETVAKKWMEIDQLREEKKPYIDGDPARKAEDGTWWVKPYHGQWVKSGASEGDVTWK